VGTQTATPGLRCRPSRKPCPSVASRAVGTLLTARCAGRRGQAGRTRGGARPRRAVLGLRRGQRACARTRLGTACHAGLRRGTARTPDRAETRRARPGCTREGDARGLGAARRAAAPGIAPRGAPRPRQGRAREPRRAPKPRARAGEGARGGGGAALSRGHRGRAEPGARRPCQAGRGPRGGDGGLVRREREASSPRGRRRCGRAAPRRLRTV
jgi:hypothetical protein